MPRAILGERRSGPAQRARSLATRRRVVRAAIELIAEGGLQRATGTAIAERSGVSWGGIQHQFGDKAAILDAVLEQVLAEFEARVERFSTRAARIEGRVKAWVAASWELHRDPTYQAFREVMRSASPPGGAAEAAHVLGRVEAALRPMRERLFPELPAAKLELANVILFATLSGMAEQASYAVVPPELVRQQLRVLGETLIREIEGASRSIRSSRG